MIIHLLIKVSEGSSLVLKVISIHQLLLPTKFDVYRYISMIFCLFEKKREKTLFL